MVAVAIACAAGRAGADPSHDFGRRGTFVLAADRVMPLLAYTEEKATGNNFSTSTSVTSLSFFSYGVPSGIAYTIPRLALDYAIAPNITIGGSVAAFWQLSNSTTTKIGPMTDSGDNPKVSGWEIAPRVGYTVALGPKLVLWPRAGFSYYSESVSNPPNGGMTGTVDGFHQFALDLEGNFLILLAPHFFASLGPVIDIPLSGSTSTTQGNTTTSIDYSQFHFGVTGGLGGYF